MGLNERLRKYREINGMTQKAVTSINRDAIDKSYWRNCSDLYLEEE